MATAAATASNALEAPPAMAQQQDLEQEEDTAGEGEWAEAEGEEVMVLVDLPEFVGADVFAGARRIEIRVRLCLGWVLPGRVEDRYGGGGGCVDDAQGTSDTRP
jgi:hypothetical protein